MKTRCIMIQGTMSDAGKSVVCAALCRIFKQDGYKVAPFKSQNMALNSYITRDGFEMGRAQVMQAEAAGIEPDVRMNPVLLKPSSDTGSQVIVLGEIRDEMSAMEYHNYKKQLLPEVRKAFDELAAENDIIVIEGAGSPAEINLAENDIVNMGLAAYLNAPVLLVGDIDRGGVFASVYGSVMLLRPEERKYVKGILINKFRGDLRLFEEGRRMLEELCGIPVLGVVPYYHDIHIEEEDSVALAAKSAAAQRGKINVAVVLLRHISNFTDFNVLERDPRVHLFYSNNVDELAKADILILPGSKSTLDDLYELRRNGVAQAILRARREGATVLGVCGGYQIMGVQIRDPHHIEGPIEAMPGLGLLPMITEMLPDKVTRQVRFTMADSATAGRFPFEGYEIHMGETIPVEGSVFTPLNRLEDGHDDGCFVDEKCMGSYLHGLLDNPAFIDRLLAPHSAKLTEAAAQFDYHAFKETQYDKLAAHVRRYVDVPLLYDILKGKR